ncbi:MAG TPA: hypothetical protein VMH81_04245 [Bryobacteraceae bacterium]|nr:hypothetical protein [Bryobacteraceae bacterium]
MRDDQKQVPRDRKPDEKKKASPRPVRVNQKIGESPGNLRKREQWFRNRSGS